MTIPSRSISANSGSPVTTRASYWRASAAAKQSTYDARYLLLICAAAYASRQTMAHNPEGAAIYGKHHFIAWLEFHLVADLFRNDDPAFG